MIWGVGAFRSGTKSLASDLGALHEPLPRILDISDRETGERIIAERLAFGVPVVDSAQSWFLPEILKADREAEIVWVLRNPVEVATSLALAGLPIPKNYESRDLFVEGYERDFVISARDRCDYTIDRIRTVRTENFRYIRNFLTDRPLLQPQYRDNRDYTQALRKGHAEGTLPKLVDEIFFGPRPREELYDHRNDPHEIHNLAANPKFKEELERHRAILTKWIEETDDKGQYPESDAGLLEVLRQWKKACVNPEYDRVRGK